MHALLQPHARPQLWDPKSHMTMVCEGGSCGQFSCHLASEVWRALSVVWVWIILTLRRLACCAPCGSPRCAFRISRLGYTVSIAFRYYMLVLQMPFTHCM